MTNHVSRAGALLALAVVALIAVQVLGPTGVSAQQGQGSACPIPQSDIPANGSLGVCVDKGDGATYRDGEPIRICVTANIPQILIFPPPPPPTIQMTSAVNGVERGVIFEEDFASGERCIERVVGAPFGQETVRAVAIGSDGREFLSDTVNYQTVPDVGTPGPSTRYVAAELDLTSPCIPAAGSTACDATRAGLWNGDPAAWAQRGVTQPDAVFNETVVFRVQQGDPAAIRNIAQLLGQPYLKITRVDFAQGREVVEITNLGSGSQDITGWTVRSPGRGVSVTLPSEVLAGGDTCYVLTGEPGGTAGFECRVFTGTPQNPPVAPPDGIWPDDAGTVVLSADPIGLVADETRYSADRNNQPPPPNVQGTRLLAVDPPAPGPLTFTLSVAQSTVPPGQPVEFQMLLRNVGTLPQTLTFPSGQDFDITVRRQNGDEVWVWSSARSFIQVVREVTLQPGQEQAFTATWNPEQESGPAAGPGSYEATAVLTTNAPVRSNPVPFTIAAGTSR